MKNLNAVQKTLYVIGMICFAFAMVNIFKGEFTMNTFFLAFCSVLMLGGPSTQNKLTKQD
jgi:hypothetical protein